MAAPVGNQYWRIRLTHGRPKCFETPEALMEEINAYFKFVEENPLKEAVLMKAKVDRDTEEVKIYKLSKLRAMTIQGLCNFLGISVETFYDYGKQKDFSEVITRAKQVMFSQKLEGAAAGMLNPSIIARELGLAEKSETKVIQEQPLFSDEPDAEEDLGEI
jgi:hypothetical protein